MNKPMARLFRLAARGAATAILRQGAEVEVPYEQDGIPIRLLFRTRYLDRGHQILVPGDLWLDAMGEAKDLSSAAAVFTNAGRDMASFVALAANAAVAPLEPELIFEVRPETSRREHFQRYVRPDDFAFTSRFIDPAATAGLITAVATSPERDRLVRATSHYCEALRDWRVGHELLALSHLFMGVEAIKTASLRHYLATKNMAREALAGEWGFADNGRLTIAAFLDQEARVRLVFKGDVESHRLARRTSDAFEHGLENAGKLYEPAGQCLVATAAYLRQAIIEVANVPDDIRKALLSDAFKRPRGPAGVDSYIRSTLVGAGEDLAAAGNEYPHYGWKHQIKCAFHGS